MQDIRSIRTTNLPCQTAFRRSIYASYSLWSDSARLKGVILNSIYHIYTGTADENGLAGI